MALHIVISATWGTAFIYPGNCRRVHLLNVGMRLPEEVDADIQTISAAPDCSLENQALQVEFNAPATCQRRCQDTARGSDTATP